MVFTCSSCNDNYISSIPDYPVHLELNLTTSYPTFRENPYQFLVFEKPRYSNEYLGFGGILVVCGFGSNSAYEYFSYDLACPHEADKSIKVVPNDMGQAICEKCKSTYDIVNGFGIPINNSISKEPLKRYKVIQNGDYLYIMRK
ncbi:hypothetical protein MASR2M117_20640 [Paludibacter sp.]